MEACITLTMPVMWNMGTTASVTLSAAQLPHSAAGHRVVHDAFVRVHAPLGQPGGAAGVGQHRQVLRPHHQCGRFAGAGEASLQAWACPPAAQARVAGAQPVCPGRGRCIITRTSASNASVNWVTTRCASARRVPMRCWPWPAQAPGRRGDGHLGVGIGDVVLELFGPVHRVDRAPPPRWPASDILPGIRALVNALVARITKGVFLLTVEQAVAF
jgi:hypothetical protein